MNEHSISTIYPSDSQALAKIDRLLKEEGISRDRNLDYTCAIFDDDLNIIATGSCFGNTLRCMAVDHHYQGTGLMNQIVSHLVEVQYERGNSHIFIYTKLSTSMVFKDLGFYEIARVDDRLVFMENKRNGFEAYLSGLEASKRGKAASAIVMNANPFTLGHQFLIETASKESSAVHLFIVSEDASLFPYPVRKELIQKGTAHLKNVMIHDCGPYMISNATFPSYFLKDDDSVIKSHAKLDIKIFSKIAQRLSINERYIGEEPYSKVTGLYNDIMLSELPKQGIACKLIKRRQTSGGTAISASLVRDAVKRSDLSCLEELVPKSTLKYLKSKEAAPVIKRIMEASEVAHY